MPKLVRLITAALVALALVGAGLTCSYRRGVARGGEGARVAAIDSMRRVNAAALRVLAGRRDAAERAAAAAARAERVARARVAVLAPDTLAVDGVPTLAPRAVVERITTADARIRADSGLLVATRAERDGEARGRALAEGQVAVLRAAKRPRLRFSHGVAAGVVGAVVLGALAAGAAR